MFNIDMTLTLDIKTFDRVIAQVPGRISQAVKQTAFMVEADAKQLAPVDTGALRNSIHTNIESAYMAHVSDGVEYGVYQELGTYKMRAQPFMTPAAEMHRDFFFDQLAKVFI